MELTNKMYCFIFIVV